MVVGTNVARRDGFDKVTGRARYVDDLGGEGMLHGRTVRSSVAKGRLEGIEFEAGLPWDEIVVVTAADVPGVNRVKLIDLEQPFLVEQEIRHRQEPVVLLAHANRDLLARAVRGVRLVVTPADPVLSLDESRTEFLSRTLEKGSVDVGLAEADVILEGTYETGAQEHVYIEPQGMLAVPHPDGGVTIHGSLQCPYYVQPAVALLLGLRPERVRVIQAATGGGFGGKEEYPSIIAGHAALLAVKSGRPVKLVYERMEDMAATTKRHPSRIRHRTGVTREGRLTALDTEIVLDGGAYLTLSPVVLSRSLIHAPGPYRWPNVRVRGRVMTTNYPPHGAFRGFGAPQSIFALEVHLDRVARAVGLDPLELRRRNLLRSGDLTATGQTVDTGVDVGHIVDVAMADSRYTDKRVAFDTINRDSRYVKRGIGLAAFMHGAGFTGNGEIALASQAGLEVSPDGTVTILASSAEIGQGSATTHAQIVSETLGLPLAMIMSSAPDTAIVPDSGPTVASRTAMVVGGLLARAARDLLDTLRERAGLPQPHSVEDFQASARRYLAEHGSLTVTVRYQPPSGRGWDERKFTGDAYAGYGWACYVAEVVVDTRTGEVNVVDFHAVQEVGRVIHPVIAQGQIEGGVAQGIGFALYEHVVWENGVMANPRLTNYIIPTSADMPEVHVRFLEVPLPSGPFGAKGLGELPLDGTAPAIVNAINMALRTEIASIPALPEVVLDALTR
jgi:CO/xanthine dehydrogenase Mo-binding subunit